jgi:carbonic anhydrase
VRGSGSIYPEDTQSDLHDTNYLLATEAKTDGYDVQAFVLCCFDHRFWKSTKDFLKFMGLFRVNPITVAGGAKVFASSDKEQDFGYMMRELERSIDRYKTHRCLLFTHHDCGAYGGFGRFHNDAGEEFTFHQIEHQAIRRNITAKFSHLKVETYFVDDHGVIKTS